MTEVISKVYWRETANGRTYSTDPAGADEVIVTVCDEHFWFDPRDTNDIYKIEKLERAVLRAFKLGQVAKAKEIRGVLGI